MPSKKDRLYVTLYARGGAATMPGGEDAYHWALIVGPKDEGKNEKGKCYHAKTIFDGSGRSQWEFEKRNVYLAPTINNLLLTRVLVAKVANIERLDDVVHGIPVQQGNPGWNCVSWVQEALQALKEDGKALGTSIVDWKDVRDAAMSYVQRKMDDHRFDGKGKFDIRKAPTFDLIKGIETVL
ncbi:hypothetical protein E6O75_ATG06751 [Venturia nashicola]|uniref:Uncharacterized protein n=1 Tax=Venturia nashicola TaxID=86259 RepID=A0A4Z1P4Z3_9PEZI|nr:hypothetical protein E6O75_ATG06751 [Venturia nashicola]